MKALVLHKPTWIDRVGLGAVAASSSRGARTICIDVDDDKVELARAAGGAHAINTNGSRCMIVGWNESCG
jgi:threonine dehydrogenase-like Zn-dependent dehydrogenase